MRICEITESVEELTDSEVNLITALNLLRGRYQDSKQDPIIKTQSLIRLVNNTDRNFNYDSLVAANKNPSVQNLIKDYNQDTVTLNIGDNDEQDGLDSLGLDTSEPERDEVKKMAKSAARERGAAL